MPVTSQKYIQSLIDDIDGILPKAEARLPWSKPGDVAAQRRVLERVRSYLVSEQQNVIAATESPSVPATPEQQEVLQQIVQAVTQEMDFIRANLMQPLREEVESLRQQRETLVQEIRQLERAKQQFDSIRHQKNNEQQIISELSQELIQRCSEDLTQQLAQVLVNWEVRLANRESTEAIAPALANQTNVGSVMHPQERLDQLRQLQDQSDRLLTNLDANQRAIFEALQRNIQGYQESLSQGLDKMHRLGTQGEMLFTALVNRLAQQLGREASTLLQSSLQLSDSAHQTNEAATSQPTPGTLLPTNALKVTEPITSEATPLTPVPNPLPEIQTPFQSLPLVEGLSISTNTPSSASEQGEIFKATATPLVPQPEKVRSPLDDTRSPTLPAQSQPSAQDILLDNLDSEAWEIIEGLDLENLDFESDDSEIETFIQLDIDSQSSLPLSEEHVTSSALDAQQPEPLSDILPEKLPTLTPPNELARVDEVAGLDDYNEAAALDVSSDSHRQEIDELYQSLFGTNTSTDEALPEESDLGAEAQLDSPALKKNLADFQKLEENQLSDTDSVTPLSSQVEDVLFEGLADPAAENLQAQPLDWSTGQLEQSLDAMFFEDTVAGSPLETDLVAPVQASLLPANPVSDNESASDQEDIETISALTDLFEEMGLSNLLPVAEADSLPATTQERSPKPTVDLDPQANLVEDTYIPASPDEDLLFTDESESEPDRQILVDHSTLQKLSEDLYSFEESESQNLRTQEQQRSPGDYGNPIDSLPVSPEADQSAQENLRFPMWEELLAEDWEEFALNDLSEEASTSESLKIGATTDLSIQQPIQLDINQESDVTDSVLVEMLWDEQTDRTIEEMISSPDLEFDSDFFSQEAFDTQPEDTSTLDEQFLSRNEPDRSLDITEGTTLPPRTLENEADSVLQKAHDLKPEKKLAHDDKTLSEHQPIESPNPDAQISEPPNFDKNLPQPDSLNSARLDNPQKKNIGSDSEANL